MGSTPPRSSESAIGEHREGLAVVREGGQVDRGDEHGFTIALDGAEDFALGSDDLRVPAHDRVVVCPTGVDLDNGALVLDRAGLAEEGPVRDARQRPGRSRPSRVTK